MYRNNTKDRLLFSKAGDKHRRNVESPTGGPVKFMPSKLAARARIEQLRGKKGGEKCFTAFVYS